MKLFLVFNHCWTVVSLPAQRFQQACCMLGGNVDAVIYPVSS